MWRCFFKEICTCSKVALCRRNLPPFVFFPQNRTFPYLILLSDLGPKFLEDLIQSSQIPAFILLRDSSHHVIQFVPSLTGGLNVLAFGPVSLSQIHISLHMAWFSRSTGFYCHSAGLNTLFPVACHTCLSAVSRIPNSALPSGRSGFTPPLKFLIESVSLRLNLIRSLIQKSWMGVRNVKTNTK